MPCCVPTVTESSAAVCVQDQHFDLLCESLSTLIPCGGFTVLAPSYTCSVCNIGACMPACLQQSPYQHSVRLSTCESPCCSYSHGCYPVEELMLRHCTHAWTFSCFGTLSCGVCPVEPLCNVKCALYSALAMHMFHLVLPVTSLAVCTGLCACP